MKILQRYLRRKPRRNFTKLEERRRRGMDLLAKGFSQAEVARRCQVSETTSFRWRQAWLRKGPQAWKRGKLGRPPKNGLGSPTAFGRDRSRTSPTQRRIRTGMTSV